MKKFLFGFVTGVVSIIAYVNLSDRVINEGLRDVDKQFRKHMGIKESK